MTELTIVKENLMTVEGYAPYCGNDGLNMKICSNPRTKWNQTLEQFQCPLCGWVSLFPADFIIRYKEKWNK